MQDIDVKKILLITLYVFTALLAFNSMKSWTDSLVPSGGDIVLQYGQYAGVDFLYFYAAAKLVLSGHINDLYTGALISGTNSSVVPELGTESMHPWAWLYPPHYLLMVVPLALLPYYYALALWRVVSLALTGFLLWHSGKLRGGLFLTTIFNVSLVYSLIFGQNALIFAGIAGTGIYLLEKRQLLAGLCFAVLSMKPHFAIMIPVALILGKYWKALASTIISTLLLMIITSFTFGWDMWGMSAMHLNSLRPIMFSPDTKFFSIYSSYIALLNLGLSIEYSWYVYYLIAILAFYGFCKIWLGKHDITTKWLAYVIAAVLCSPYNLAYDAVWVLSPIMVWLSNVIAQNYKLPIFIYLLLVIQIFAFVVVSISHSLAILVIISALIILLWIAHSDTLINNKLQAIPV